MSSGSGTPPPHLLDGERLAGRSAVCGCWRVERPGTSAYGGRVVEARHDAGCWRVQPSSHPTTPAAPPLDPAAVNPAPSSREPGTSPTVAPTAACAVVAARPAGTPRLAVHLLLALLAVAGPAAAAEDNPNADPVTISVQAGAVATLSGDTGTAVTPTGWIEVEGPLAVGKTSLARVYTRLGITSLPGEQLDVSDPATFKAAEVGFGLGRIVGRLRMGEQDVTTTVVAEWGFASRLPEPEPAQRLVRHYGAGVRLQERKSGASLTILYGRDEAAGDRGYGQWLVYGQVPIAGTKGAVVLVGDATLSAGPEVAGRAQRDVLRLGVAASLGALLDVIR